MAKTKTKKKTMRAGVRRVTRKDSPTAAKVRGDWTADKYGVCNSSERYLFLVGRVERLIRTNGPAIVNGEIESVARLIVSQLAHEHGVMA